MKRRMGRVGQEGAVMGDARELNRILVIGHIDGIGAVDRYLETSPR